MNAAGHDEGGRRHERSTSGGSKRGRRAGEDFGRDNFAEEDDGSSSGGGVSGPPPTSTSVGRAKHGKEAATGDGRAELIRRRNCENARKARARKKLEVNQLRDQVEKLKQLHARARAEARKAKELRTRTEMLRRQTLRTFMQYRCSNVKSYQQWAEIVDERFTMTLPITPYRWFNGQDVYNDSRILRGIEHLMTDNGSLAVLIESLGCGTLPWRQEMEKGRGHGVELVCDMADSDIITTQNTAMCSFLLRTTNAVEHGAKREWVCRGMLSAKFNPVSGSVKLLAAEHVFDVTSLMQQLQKVIGEENGMPIVPNTPGGACQPSNEARIITTATPPYTVVCCNEAWTKLCGHTQQAIQGQTLRVIQGPCTDTNALEALKSEIQRGRATSSLLLNYKRDGTMFLNYLRIYPLVGDARGTITHFLGVLQEQAERGRADEAKSSFVGGAQQQQQQQRQEAAPGLRASVLAASTKREEEDQNPWRGRRSVEFGATAATPMPATTAYIPGEMRPPGSAGEARAGVGGGAGGRLGAAEARTSSSARGSFSRASIDPNRVCILSLVKNETTPLCAPGGEGGRGAGGQEAKMEMEIGVPSRGNSQEQQPMSSSKVPATAIPPERPRHGHQHQLHPKQEQGEEGGEEEEGLRSRTNSLSPLVGSLGRYYGPPHEGGEGMGVCEAHLDEDAAAGAFLAWEDVLAGSPDPPLDGGGLGVGEANHNSQDGLAQVGVLAAAAAPAGEGLSPPAATAGSVPSAHLTTPSLGEVDRMRSHSDSAVAKGGMHTLDSSWRLAIGGSAFDLSSLPEEPVEGGRGGLSWQGVGLE